MPLAVTRPDVGKNPRMNGSQIAELCCKWWNERMSGIEPEVIIKAVHACTASINCPEYFSEPATRSVCIDPAVIGMACCGKLRKFVSNAYAGRAGLVSQLCAQLIDEGGLSAANTLGREEIIMMPGHRPRRKKIKR